MKVSIITPFYYGNDYIRKYEDMLDANEKALEAGDTLEVLLINDSPEEPVRLRGLYYGRKNWRIIKNEYNMGIHASRVRGYFSATGDYIIFLDQDDRLADDAVRRFLQRAKEEKKPQDRLCYRLLVANALLEQRDGRSLLWYRTKYHKKQVGRLRPYLSVGTQIISPGQCMLAKEIIPQEWIANILSENGADDYFLWLLLLYKGIDAAVIDEPLYVHGYTEKNLSADTTVTDASTMQFIEVLEETDFPKKELALLKRQTAYKAAFRAGGLTAKLKETLKNPDLFLVNLWFKLRTRTGYGFNRR